MPVNIIRSGSNIEDVKATQKLLKRFVEFRPNRLATPLLRLFSPAIRRRIVDIQGLKLYCDPISYWAREYISTGHYEPDTWTILEDLLREGDNFLDVGANEGIFSCAASRLVGASGTIVALEPQKDIFSILELNAELNSFARYVLVNSAMGTSSGPAVIQKTTEANSGGTGFVKRQMLGTVEKVSVTTAADMLNACGVFNFKLVKIDVEGFENNVVLSLSNAITTKKVKIENLLVDYHHAINSKNGVSGEQIEETIFSLGYAKVREQHSNLFSGYRLYTLR